MKIRLMSDSDIDKVAHLHQNNLITPTSKIGWTYLKKLYEQLVSRSDLHTGLVAENQHEIVGVLLATKDLSETLKILKKLLTLKTFLAIFKAIMAGKLNIVDLIYRARFEYTLTRRYQKPYPTILSLFVARKYQKQGIGKKMIKELLTILKQQKVMKLFTDTDISNLKAQAFYKAIGFKKVGKVTNSFIFEKEIT